jgi:acetyl-CoA synthetase
MGTAEIESAMVAHPKVSEAAVVGVPHDIKGQGIYVYVTLNGGEAIRAAAHGAAELGAQGNRPDCLARRDPVGAGPAEDPLGQDHAPHPAQDCHGGYDGLGDISTLADPGVVQHLIDTHKTMNVA